jgi:tungstate transport system substrate-binding protein
LSNQDTLDQVILVEGDPGLLNVYHVIVVNPDKFPGVNVAGASAFAEFMVSPETQQQIEQFGLDEFGESLFFPDADKTDADFGLE